VISVGQLRRKAALENVACHTKASEFAICGDGLKSVLQRRFRYCTSSVTVIPRGADCDVACTVIL
jgi:hypothetical protein